MIETFDRPSEVFAAPPSGAPAPEISHPLPKLVLSAAGSILLTGPFDLPPDVYRGARQAVSTGRALLCGCGGSIVLAAAERGATFEVGLPSVGRRETTAASRDDGRIEQNAIIDGP